MIDATQIAAAMQVPCLLSGDMIQQMQLWEELYLNRAGWIRNRIRSCHIPANIAQELKRLTLTEFSATVHDAAELEQAVRRVLPKLRRKMDFGLAIGGLLLKPYFTAQGVSVDIVPQNAYLPVNYTDDSCDAVVCPEEISIGKNYYTRLELHVYSQVRQTHTIQNRCFCSASPGILGTECSLDAVPQWADVLPEKVYENVQRPLFAIFQTPDSNNIDPTSPLGVSVFADAVDFIRDADEHWERILWELESSERAIDAVGLSYGTLSEVSDVEKTAEEVRSSKQRSFSRVKDIQENLRNALEQMLYGMQFYQDYYRSQSSPPVKATFAFGDGVLEDPDVEYQRRVQMVRDKLLRPELFLAWYFDCSEEKAAKMMPERQDDGGLFSGGEI